MKSIKLIIVLLFTFLCSYAQERVSATYDVQFSKNVGTAYINGKEYSDVVVYIETSKQGLSFSYPYSIVPSKMWVKVKVKDSNKKTVYSKKLMKSGLFVYDRGKNMQIGKADNVVTEAILKKEPQGEWYFKLDENGIEE